MSSSDFSEKSSVVPTRWRPLFATRGAVCCFSMPSFAVSSSTSSRCQPHRKSNQTLQFYTELDILPLVLMLLKSDPKRFVKSTYVLLFLNCQAILRAQ